MGEHSFGVWIVRIRCLLFEICLMKKKKKKKTKKKMEIFTFHFLDREKKSWDSGGVFDIGITKGFYL